MTIKRREFLTIPAALATTACLPFYKSHKSGNGWVKFQYYYDVVTGVAIPVAAIGPHGEWWDLHDPNSPAKFRKITDGFLGGIATGGTGSKFAEEAPLLYALDRHAEDSIVMYDSETGRYVGEFPVGDSPQGMCPNADFSRIYVTHLEIAQGNPFFPAAPPRLTVWNRITRTLVTTINLPSGKIPRMPRLSPDGNTIYIPHDDASSASIMMVDPNTNTYKGEIPLGTTGAIGKLVVTPDGSMIYGSNIQSFPARIYAIDVASSSLAATLTGPSSIKDIILNPTATRLYTASESRIVVYDTATFSEIARIDVANNPRINQLSVSFDGDTLLANKEFDQSVILFRTADNTFQEVVGDASQRITSSFVLAAPYIQRPTPQ
jgi:DNA-binding beta-propeller fold protein YncE